MPHRFLAAGLVLAGAPASAACGPLTTPRSSAESAPAGQVEAGRR
jgi:hypothetical protein